MFTGLVENVGTLRRLDRTQQGHRIVVSHTPWDRPLATGDSIAVQGICLTVSQASPSEFSADVLSETLKRTNLRNTSVGCRINLERAISPRDRFGGHFVTGHVDGTGRIASIEKHEQDKVIWIRFPSALEEFIAVKGSIACDGISLTISGQSDSAFSVHVIPHTWKNTSLSDRRSGDAVNLEVDILARYVHRHLSTLDNPPKSAVDVDLLRQNGFLDAP